MRNKHFAGIISNQSEESKSFCPRCEKRNHLSLLQPKIIEDPSKPLPSDYDQFKQCYRCGLIVPIYNVRHEGSVYSDLEIVDNPFDQGKAIVTGPKTDLKTRVKRVTNRRSKHPDKEVQKELDKGNIVTNYSTDMT